MDHEPLPHLAIVVVNYGSHELLRSNLTRVGRDTRGISVVVVDNFTSVAEQKAVAELASAHSWLTVLLDTNTGFGGGVNRGIEAGRKAGATTFLLLNPDASIAAPDVAVLRRRSAADPLALISPRVVTSDGVPWFEGADLYLENGVSRARRKRRLHPGARTRPWLSGACLIMSDELWTRIGGFDEEYFLYWEDVDLSFRVMDAGGRLEVAEDAVAIHDEGGTQAGEAHASGSRAKSSTYYYYNIRNRLLFAARHLAEEDRRRWVRGAVPAAWAVLLQGGRRQFRHPVAPLRAAIRGTVDGLRLARAVRRSTP